MTLFPAAALLFSLAAPLPAAQQAATAGPAAPRPLFAPVSAPVATAVQDLLGSRAGAALIKADPFWSGFDSYLNAGGEGPLILAPVIESLPKGLAEKLPGMLTLGDIDARPAAERMRLVEAFVVARARAVERVEAKAQERLEGSAGWLSIAQWEAASADLAPFSRFHGRAGEAFDKVARMVSELKRLRAEASMAAELRRVAVVWEQGADGELIMAQPSLSMDPDWAAAVKTLRAAILDEDQAAVTRVAQMHELGFGNLVSRDPKRAAFWYGLAAETDVDYDVVKNGGGHPAAQLALGRMYQDGRGVKPDFSSAYQLYALAARSGDLEARARLRALAAGAEPRALTGAQDAVEHVGRKERYIYPAQYSLNDHVKEILRLKTSEEQSRGLTNMFWGMVVAPVSAGLGFLAGFPWGLLVLAAVNGLMYGLGLWATRAERARLRALIADDFRRAETD